MNDHRSNRTFHSVHSKGQYAYDFGDASGLTPMMNEALTCKETGESTVILFNLTGHRHFDMSSYDRYFSSQLEKADCPAEAVAESLAPLPKFG